MATSSKKELAFQKKYNAQPAQIKKREENNVARYAALKAGTVQKGDDKQVDHKRMLDTGGTNAPSNRRVISRATNAAWRKKNPGAYGK